MKFFITLNKLNLIYGTLNSLGSVFAASSDRARPSKKLVNIAIFHVYGEDTPSNKNFINCSSTHDPVLALASEIHRKPEGFTAFMHYFLIAEVFSSGAILT